MIPKEQKEHMSAMGDLSGPVPSLDLGKKLSVPQDLMMEELSLRNNRGSLLFQKRQRRVQRFIFELTASQRGAVNGPEGQENYRSELHIFPATSGPPQDARPATASAERPRTPSALAPGYSEPLKSVPPEKFNHTAIPKAYRCPWEEFVSYRDYQRDGRSYIPSASEYRNFNKTPVPFGGPLVGDTVPKAAMPFVPELTTGLELLRRRPSFNRVAQGWVRHLPESEDL
ncbi:myozenin-3 [Elephas maximus indicus]|uniref:myozenin-3 n=1 Tax=Elephas maximus indicus TaxID=99487 RepID=UPI002116C97A|nr:myozenin-3 [Elephas maximus indicus]